MSEGCGSDERCIENSDTMVNFVFLLDTTKNGNRFGNRGLVDKNLLESTFESGIFFDMLLNISGVSDHGAT